MLTLGLAFPGLSDASGGLGNTFPGAGRHRQESGPEGHSCFSVSACAVCKSLSTNHLVPVDKSVQALKTQFLGVRKEEGLSFSHPQPSLPTHHLSAMARKMLRMDAKAEAWGSQWREIVGKDLDLGSPGRLGLRCFGIHCPANV